MIQFLLPKEHMSEYINVRQRGNKDIIFSLSKLTFKKPDPHRRNLVEMVHWLDAQRGVWGRGGDKKRPLCETICFQHNSCVSLRAPGQALRSWTQGSRCF